MDSKRFSELTKALANGQSRRGVVKGLAAGLVGGVLGLRGRDNTEARTPAGPGRVCREHANCDEDLYCLYDSKTRRSKCTCVQPRCFDNCERECLNFNGGFSFNFQFDDNCTDECAYRCIDTTCRYYFNQSKP
jgi:hypothetical protein